MYNGWAIKKTGNARFHALIFFSEHQDGCRVGDNCNGYKVRETCK